MSRLGAVGNGLLASTFLAAGGLVGAAAQERPQPDITEIRPVRVDATRPRAPRQQTTPVRRTAVPLRAPAPQAAPSAPPSVWSTPSVQSGAAGTTGYVATEIRSATKTETP